MSDLPSSDVTCRSIMATSFPVLHGTMSIVQCVMELLRFRVLAMPVVDGEGRYLGQFRKNLLIAEVLPQVAVQDERFERIERMIDTGLLSDTMKDVRNRFAAIADNPVLDHLDKKAPVLRPDQPMVTAMFYLFRGRNFLPVVEPANGKLVGVVSAWDVLENIIKQG